MNNKISQELGPELKNISFFLMERIIKEARNESTKLLKQQNIDVTVDQWLVLKTISEHEEITSQQIAEYIGKDKASITRILEILLSKKYVIKKSSNLDGRKKIIELTKKGYKTCLSTYTIAHSVRVKSEQGISSSDRKKLNDLLLKVLKNLT